MNSRGFTLIELMIVVSIIGVLAAIALPPFHNYTTRAQLSEALFLSNEIKTSVTAYYQRKGTFPANNRAAGVPEAGLLIGNYTSGIEVSKGAIHITLGNRINQTAAGKIISLRPLVVKGSPSSPISWACGYATAPEGMLAKGENRTDIAVEILPFACHE